MRQVVGEWVDSPAKDPSRETRQCHHIVTEETVFLQIKAGTQKFLIEEGGREFTVGDRLMLMRRNRGIFQHSFLDRTGREARNLEEIDVVYAEATRVDEVKYPNLAAVMDGTVTIGVEIKETG